MFSTMGPYGSLNDLPDVGIGMPVNHFLFRGVHTMTHCFHYVGKLMIPAISNGLFQISVSPTGVLMAHCVIIL